MITISIGIAILAMYLTYVIIEDGCVPSSISDSYYSAGKWFFSIVMIVEGLLLVASTITITPYNLAFMPFLMGAGLMMVGAAPHCRDDYDKRLHYVGAIAFALSSQAWYLIVPMMMTSIPVMLSIFLAVWLVAVVLMFLYNRCMIFIAEIACVIIIFVGRLAAEVW